MKKTAILISSLLAFLSGLSLSSIRSCRSNPTSSPAIDRIDTIRITDTIQFTHPTATETHNAPIRAYPVNTSIPLRDSTINHSSDVPPTSVSSSPVVRVDSDSIYLAPSRRIYTDGKSYRAVVSGIDPSLDSLTLYTSSTIVTHTLSTPASPLNSSSIHNPASHWSLSLSAIATTPAIALTLTYHF